MVTMVIVFEELNRVVSLSPTKERMKTTPSWGEGNRFWRLAMRADHGEIPRLLVGPLTLGSAVRAHTQC